MDALERRAELGPHGRFETRGDELGEGGLAGESGVEELANGAAENG